MDARAPPAPDALSIALALHVPLVPIRFFDWIRFAFRGGLDDYDDADAAPIVPIDVELLERDPVAEPPKPEPPPPPAPAPEPAPVTHDAPKSKPKPKPKPKSDDADAGAPAPLRDPTGAAGGAGKIAAKDPNVQILLSGKVLRKHELGAWAARILVSVPEWHGFFEGTPIDPVRDLDHLLITGPRLKGDVSKMVAVMDFNLPAEGVHEAVDRVVHRTEGVWLEDAPVTTARARIGGSPHLFAILPERRLLVILPGEAMDQLERLKKAKGFRNSAEGLVVSLLTPARPFKEFFPLPESLKWLRAAVTPTADGGADLALDAGDRSPEDAEAHAASITAAVEARRKIDVLGLTSVEVVDPIVFKADGDVIRARTHLPAPKLRAIMDLLEKKAHERYAKKAGEAP